MTAHNGGRFAFAVGTEGDLQQITGESLVKVW
jgi:hypothetical protein